MSDQPRIDSVGGTYRGFRRRNWATPVFLVLALATQAMCSAEKINVKSLLREMVDFENLAERPRPFFKQAIASSYSRASRKGVKPGLITSTGGNMSAPRPT